MLKIARYKYMYKASSSASFRKLKWFVQFIINTSTDKTYIGQRYPVGRERETLYVLSMFTTVTLAIGYYNRHIHSSDGDTTHKNTYTFSLYSLNKNSFRKRTKVCFISKQIVHKIYNYIQWLFDFIQISTLCSMHICTFFHTRIVLGF